ncbi:acyl-CoA dehydrogenase family protein [Kibdelosporangium aridum]|uniref:acyl-CoA dehydrogenase family protein n=1 Tax=Kibdelosporangium aridum TaxID=2030 RepID=UPI0035E6FFBE
MAIAINENHRMLAESVGAFLVGNDARAMTRELLENPRIERPKLWAEAVSLGLLGIHVPEEHGGEGFGLPELVVVLEQFGRHLAPGALLPTVTASAVLADLGSTSMLRRLTDGTSTGAVGLDGSITLEDNGSGIRAYGGATVLGGCWSRRARARRRHGSHCAASRS